MGTISFVSKVLSNGLKAISATEHFGSRVITKTRILDKYNNRIIDRIKSVDPTNMEFRHQRTTYNLAENVELGIQKEYARLGRNKGDIPRIQESVSVKYPGTDFYSPATSRDLYDFGTGFFS